MRWDVNCATGSSASSSSPPCRARRSNGWFRPPGDSAATPKRGANIETSSRREGNGYATRCDRDLLQSRLHTPRRRAAGTGAAPTLPRLRGVNAGALLEVRAVAGRSPFVLLYVLWGAAEANSATD